MNLLVRDDGFHSDDLSQCEFATIEQLLAGDENSVLLQLEVDADPLDFQGQFSRISAIRISFPNFDDGRGFSLAVRLRQLGFNGRLGASGHLIADQYPLARRSGFDEVVIDELMAARQPESQWRARSAWKELSYQKHILKSA